MSDDAFATIVEERLARSASSIEVVAGDQARSAVARRIATRARRRHVRGIALITVIALLAGGSAVAIVASGRHTAQPTASHAALPSLFDRDTTPRTVVEHALDATLDTVHVPAGSLRTSNLPAPLGHPQSVLGSPYFVDRSRAWIIPVSFADAIAYIESHPPAGWRAVPASSGPGWRALNMSYQRPAPAPTAETFSVAIARRSATSVWARADAGGVWHPRRAAATLAPANTRTVTLIETTATVTSPTRRAVRTVTVDQPASVRRLVAAFDALPTSTVFVSWGCPPQPQPEFIVEFRSARDAPPIVVATIHDCLGISITVGGRAGPALEDGSLATDVRAAFGLA